MEHTVVAVASVLSSIDRFVPDKVTLLATSTAGDAKAHCQQSTTLSWRKFGCR